MIKTFNPDLLNMPIFKTFDIAIPVLTPLVNIDQIISVLAGIPRGTIDNIVNSFNQINNFLTTPAITKVNKSTSINEYRILIFNLADAFNNNIRYFE